ncbi:MAG TPA: carboxymuconolactone decarboxylase family protein [Solirubrobacteraceae bacterium]|nr:carboxymuconolactone decarboxylase family protein [Solirubrobacteraceae bacterium]
MSNAIPADRLQLSESATRQYGAMLNLSASVEIDEVLRALIDVRVSQLNGCAFCLDMHWRDARAAGLSEERLYMLDAWRESTLYDEREQTALDLCEAVTMITEGHVPEHTWERAQAAFSERELGQLIFAITVINAWNRLLITARAKPGHYTPGQFSGPQAVGR